MYSILRVSSFYREKVANCRIFSEFLTRNSSSKTQKNSPTGSAKANALMVGGMFAVEAMNYWGERFTKVGTMSGLLGIVPWCAIAACNAAFRSNGDGCGLSWIGDLNDTQNPWRMLLIDIQCFIVHIMGQSFECERFGVISAILELQFTNHSWKSCLEFSQINGTWPSVDLLNSLRGTTNLHGVYGCKNNSWQQNMMVWKQV